MFKSVVAIFKDRKKNTAIDELLNFLARFEN